MTFLLSIQLWLDWSLQSTALPKRHATSLWSTRLFYPRLEPAFPNLKEQINQQPYPFQPEYISKESSCSWKNHLTYLTLSRDNMQFLVGDIQYIFLHLFLWITGFGICSFPWSLGEQFSILERDIPELFLLFLSKEYFHNNLSVQGITKSLP